ncbi:MAG: AraC family transcriptional regulator [Rhodococcus sp.]|nr:AraC family transcriptional regulator [Rhodococcus sp. (in: high G+C Gram-positive bacteria)]
MDGVQAERGISDGVSAAPTPGLRGFVHSYDGYRLIGFEPGVHLGLPSPYLTVVLTLDGPLTVNRASGSGSFETLAGGISMAAVSLPHNGNQHGVQISLTPLGARTLLGMPTAELGDQVVDLYDVIGSDATELHERISDEPTWSGRFAICDEVLARRSADIEVEPDVRRAWGRLVSDGAARVSEVAEEIGWSRRRLATRFWAEYGVSPKDAVRLGRFHEAHRLLRHPRIPTLADIAGSCGYYDQAHMAKDWRDMAGMAPSEWRRSDALAVAQDS